MTGSLLLKWSKTELCLIIIQIWNKTMETQHVLNTHLQGEVLWKSCDAA